MKQSQDNQNRQAGTLYLVASPIGNLSDISERAAKTLETVDFIASEDTRVSRKLLGHLGIKKELISYHAHNFITAGETILARCSSGESCALLTDAGTPGISDPGEELVRLFVDNNLPVVLIPGPCAAIAGLVLSGLPAGRFVFEGFLSAKKSKRREQLLALSKEPRTLVFYEAPHKLLRTLGDMLEILGERRVSISRELTKIFEETLRFKLSGAIAHFEANPPRGEFVIVVEGFTEQINAGDALDGAVKIALDLIGSGSSKREAAKKAARETGCSANKIYDEILMICNK